MNPPRPGTIRGVSGTRGGRAAVCLAVLSWAAGTAAAQNFDHPGLVHAGKAGWVEPARARELGYFEYRGRWLPRKLAKKVKAWERADARMSGWEDRYKVKSKHYRIETDVPRFIVELEIKPFLDELYRTYVEVFRRNFGLSGRAANKKTIRIIHGYENYARNAERGRGVIPRSTPGFIVGGDELVVHYDDLHPGDFYGTVFHEGAHQFLSALLPGAALPLWLDEALATYFEGCRYSRATGKITVDALPPDRVELSQEILKEAQPFAGRSLPESLFMRVPEQSFDAREYALAWSFVHYLVHREGGKRRKAFARFLRETNGSGNKPVAEIFREATGERLEQVQTGWKDYAMALKMPPQPIFVVLAVEGEPDPRVDLATEDYLVSIGGVQIDSSARFAQAWPQRAEERPAEPREWVVLRRKPRKGPMEYEERLVRTTVPPDTPLRIVDDGWYPRAHNLRD